MKKLILTMLIAVFAIGASSIAQAATAITSWPGYAYKDGGYAGNLYAPGGWMGNHSAMGLYVNAYSTDTSVSGTSTKIGFTSGTGDAEWTGVYWLWPDGNWGTSPTGGWDLTGATNVTFWAKGAAGGEVLEFKVGGVTGTYGDTLMPGIGQTVTLSNNWTQYSFDLSGKDLSRVVGGFEFAANDTLNPSGAIFYVDDIRYNNTPIPEPASLLLIGSGLVGIFGVSRKRKA